MLYRPNGIFGDKELASMMLGKWKKRGDKNGSAVESK